MDAIVAWREQVAPIEAPDTGSLRGDIEAMIQATPDFGEDDRRMLAVISGLATAAARDPELNAAFKDHALELPRRLVRQVLDHAVARGEIPAGRELDLVPDILIGLNMLRIVLGEVPDRPFVRRVFEEIILPLVTAPHDRAETQ